MSSSIFNFDNLHNYIRLSSSKRNWHLIIFLSVLMSLIVSSIALPKLSPRVNFRTKAVAELSEETEAIFVGSSHVYCGIRPSAYSHSVMTVTISLSDYVSIEKLLQTNLKKAPNVKVVVLEADIVPLRYDTLKTFGGLNVQLRDSGIDIDDHFKLKSEFIHAQISQRFLPQIYVDSQRLNFRNFIESERAITGHEESPLTFNENTGHLQLATHIRESRDDYVPGNQEALLRIIRMLKSLDIRIVLMRFPHHSTYRQNLPKKWEEQFQNTLKMVRQEFGESGFFYWNFHELPNVIEDQEFRNGDHLNSKGAQRLTVLMDAELDKLLNGSD